MQKSVLKIYKRILMTFMLPLMCMSLFAHSGSLWGQKKLLVAKTRWFDIIYPETCASSAAILYEKADALYDEVAGQYGLSPAFRMPLVLTPAVEQFNAFWTALPYNHIVIYDTGFSASSELAVFSETLLSTFRHELTHAVTYNMKSGAWYFAGKIFGDCFVPGMLSVTTGMAEGATLTSESAAGEGRLNDEYAKHYVKQAKIEGAFPSYHDVSGSGDVSPRGSPYYFNGAFHQWLQEKYGLEAYADFWYRVVNGKNLTIAGAFKKSFGLKLKTAWKQFAEAYVIPELAANPVQAGQVQDFFEPDKMAYSQLNDAGSLYESLTASLSEPARRLVWLDPIGGRVFATDLAPDFTSSRGSSPAKIRQLFAMQGITNVRLSNDGRLLAVSYISENAEAPKARVKIYDMERNRFHSVPESGLKEAAILCADKAYYLISQKYSDQHFSIKISRINMSPDGRLVKNLEDIKEILLPVETNPFCFTPMEDGNFAFLKKTGNDYSLCIYSAEGQALSRFEFPEGMAVRSLSYTCEGDKKLFSFSYARAGTMPRFGMLDSQSGDLCLGKEDFSGGLFEPVLFDDGIVYIGEFYRQNRLLFLNRDKLQLEEGLTCKKAEDSFIQPQSLQAFEASASEALASLKRASKKYQPFPYFFRGIFIPLSNYQTEYFGINADYSSNAQNAYLGFTYVTSNPWADGKTDLFMFTAGWNVLSNAYGLDLQITKGSSSSLFRSKTELKSEFDFKGWKQGGLRFELTSTLELGRHSSLSFSNLSEAFAGRQDKRVTADFLSTIAFWDKESFAKAAPSDDTIYHKLQNVSALQYSNVRRAGPGRFEYAGFLTSLTFGLRYDDKMAYAFGGKVSFYIPRLLPFESKQGFTYNLPLRLTAAVLPVSSIYAYSQPKVNPGKVLFDLLAESTLFSMDIQKSIPGISSIYLNDFYINAGYAGTGAGSRAEKYFDSVYLKSALELTPNIGLLANPSYKMGLITTLSCLIQSPEPVTPLERIKLSFGMNVNF